MQKLLALFFTFGIAVCGLAQTPESNTPGAALPTWARLTDSTYTIRFPNTWTVDQSGLFGSRFFLFAPLDTATDKFRENFNLIINDISMYPDVTLEFLADGARQQVESMITGVQFQEFRIVHLNGDKYYSFEYSGKQGLFDLHWKQHYWVAYNKLYVLTFTAEAQQYNCYLPLANHILSSFSLK